MNPIGVDGKVDVTIENEVDIDAFIETYKQGTPIAILQHYPMSDAVNCVELQMLALKGQIQACIFSMTKDCSRKNVIIMSTSEKKVLAGENFDVGVASFVPSTLSVTLEEKNTKPWPQRSLECSLEGLDHRVILNPMPNAKDFTSVFWNLRQVSNVEDANMGL